MTKTFLQLTETINPSLPELNDEFFDYAKDIKFKHNELVKREFSLEFGDYVFKNGEFQFKNDIPDNYFSFGVILEHGFETFREGENFTPLHISLPGEVFFIDEARGIKPIFPKEKLDMTAGARSIWVAAKVSDTNSFRRMAREYHLDPQVPKTLIHEWAMLRQLAHNAHSNWRARVLVISVEKAVFFSDRCNRLRHALRQIGAPYHALLENQLRLDFNMKDFMHQSNGKAHPAIMEHVKHLYFISEGHLPGFSFATDDLLAPVDLFKEALIKIYGITYAPSIIQPGHPEPNHPCYYPLQNTNPTNPKRSHTSGIEEIKEVKKTLNNYELFLAKTTEHVQDSLFSSKRFSYFHHHPDPNNKILQSAEIPKFDPTADHDLETSKLPFCDSSPMFRAGCVAISQPKERPHDQ